MRTIVVALVVSLAGAGASAGEGQQPEAAVVSPWSVDLLAYGWISEVQGRAVVRGAGIPLDVSYDQLFDLVGAGDALAGALAVDLRYRKMGLFVDTYGAVIDTDHNIGSKTVAIDCCQPNIPPIKVTTPPGQIDVRIEQALVTFGASYRLGEWSLDRAGTRHVWIEPTVGARYAYLGVDVNARLGQAALAVSESFNIVDPVIGVRWGVDLTERLALSFTGDIGGFGADSDLTWNIVSLFGYRLPWTLKGHDIRVVAGYRVTDYERPGSGALDRLDLQLRGPVLGLATRF